MMVRWLLVIGGMLLNNSTQPCAASCSPPILSSSPQLCLPSSYPFFISTSSYLHHTTCDLCALQVLITERPSLHLPSYDLVPSSPPPLITSSFFHRHSSIIISSLNHQIYHYEPARDLRLSACSSLQSIPTQSALLLGMLSLLF